MSRQFDLLLILPLFSLYLSYLLSIVSETTRSPFDLVEAESELVGGWASTRGKASIHPCSSDMG